VAKFANGDFLTSMRHTCGIYKISGETGEAIWRFGGKISDFEQDFNFSAQHDARIVSSNETVTIISFFDNAATNKGELGDMPPTALVSSFKVVALYDNETPMRAEVSSTQSLELFFSYITNYGNSSSNNSTDPTVSSHACAAAGSIILMEEHLWDGACKAMQLNSLPTAT
jgi:hypothetical protein